MSESKQTVYLILEWIGYWCIPDHYHGGINPGPYSSFELAEAVRLEYARKIREGWASDVEIPEGFAEREEQLCLQRHRVYEAVDFPAPIRSS